MNLGRAGWAILMGASVGLLAGGANGQTLMPSYDPYGGLYYGGTFAPVAPGPLRPWPYAPFAYYDLLYGFAPAYLTAPQPSGHQITATGPNSYIYQPTYAQPPLAVATSPAVSSVVPPAVPSVSPADRAMQQATAEFQAGRYQSVIEQLQPIISANPRLGFPLLLESHAYFALGRYSEAAAALHLALEALPADQWGTILDRYRDLYRATRYTDHLRALEQHVERNPAEAAGHFLLGYHAGFLGQRQNAAPHLAQAVALSPTDAVARALLGRFGDTAPAALPTPAPRSAPVIDGPRTF
jgi:hypothetical protein